MRVQNTLVNVVKFLDMAQDQDEAVGAYMARLKGQAAVCNFSAKCVSDSCGKNIDYSEKIVCHQHVRGLSDPTIQEQTLAHAADIKDLDLATTVKFIEA